MRAHATVLSVLLGSQLLTVAARGDSQPPAIEMSPAEIAKMAVCTDGKAHYVVVAPDQHFAHKVYYGDGKNMSQVTDEAWNALEGTSFFEPRYMNPTANENFRGIDYRLISSVNLEDGSKICSLTCGTRKQALTVMSDGDAKKLLGKATFRKNLRTREAYALARDDHGVYYYVDRGNTPESQNNFRVFMGKKGALKLQKMKDVASDSEGEVFSTAGGDLRFVTSHEKKEYSWVQGEKATHLLALPVRDNLNLIYTTLGVYTGERMGNPCDDM